ncbi:MAG: dTDP-glucose 4,6-dehydratase [Deltaproteobacteria bacterium RBG_16_49_23]|nr:MAG: dTDP-glucose 4,6-dehydratase [Deltaproteobacteria bacterium RBG_16_49_23]
MRLLVTGGCGFIGSNFIRYYLKNYPEVSIINVDKLTYAGNLENLTDLSHSARYHFIRGDIADAPRMEELIRKGVDAIVNFAAESHVDRSIEDPGAFMKTNIFGTFTLLEAVRKAFPGQKIRFLHISTDEVYGSLGETGAFTEETPLAPNSPYSASKTAADMMVRAYHHTYGLPAVITRCSNNYGPYQFPEKLIPLMVSNAMEDKELPMYGDGLYIRDWIYVEDHCRALDQVLRQGREGEVYNIGGGNERTNLYVAKNILDRLGKPHSLIRSVADRPGHDRRYAIDFSKVKRELGWTPTVSFEEGIDRTVEWYQNHREWWKKIKTGEYLDYYKRMYQDR